MTLSAWEAHENASNAVRAYREALAEVRNGSAIGPEQEQLLVALEAIVQSVAAAITEASRDLILQQAATIAMLEKKLRNLGEQSGAAYPE